MDYDPIVLAHARALPHRTREQVARFFDGMDLVEPGLARVEEWTTA